MKKNSNDLISVIIPVYKNASTVSRCIRSVLAQTYKNLEIIVVYKKSSDKTLDILESIKDPRIRIIEQVENTGPGGARNIGIDNAHGDWIGFIEADDNVDSDFYEKLLKAAVENDCDIAQGNIIYGDWCSVKESGVYSKYYDKLSILQNGASFDKLFNTELVKSHDIRFAENIRWEDNIFVFKALYYGKLVTVVDVKYIYEPSEWGDEYTEKLRNDVIPACQGIADFIQSAQMSTPEKRLIKQKIVDFVANSFICDTYIYHKLMNMFGNPLFLWVRHHIRILKQKRKKDRKNG